MQCEVYAEVSTYCHECEDKRQWEKANILVCVHMVYIERDFVLDTTVKEDVVEVVMGWTC